MKLVRDLFLRCMSSVYLFAFASLYVQIPGLYGNRGILPAKNVLDKEPKSWQEFSSQPTLLRFVGRLGLDAAMGMDLFCLIGIMLSFIAFVSQQCRNFAFFFIMWMMYLSVFHVGQIFLWFQWDILLLEVGFLSILIAPVTWFPVSRERWFRQHDNITMWLVKWLLFRLMFSSAVVKLNSGCPTWWGLTALLYHYETQCIPMPLAWYAHHLPESFQKFSVVSTFMIQLVLPFMFFLPSRRYRLFAASGQVLLMVLILLTGNYNFFNIVTIFLCLSLVDDDWVMGWSACTAAVRADEKHPASVTRRRRALRLLFDVLVFGSIIFIAVRYFSLSVNVEQLKLETAVAFSAADFEKFVQSAVPLSIWIGVISLGVEVGRSLLRCLLDESGICRRLTNSMGCFVFGIVASTIFLITLVPYTVIDETTRSNLPPTVVRWYTSVRDFEPTSSYGLFRRMTGVGGRPEVIVEGSNSTDGGWLEYQFPYKPGDVYRRPPVNVPHQPRLDWQMWFAALGSYQHNPWFLNLVYRLLMNERDVMDLIEYNPFPEGAPKYIRAQLYHYHFTTPNGSCVVPSITEARNAGWAPLADNNWWCRKHVREYLPVVWMTEPNFVGYLKSANIYIDEKSREKSPRGAVASLVKFVRQLVGQADGFVTCIALLVAALAVSYTGVCQQRHTTTTYTKTSHVEPAPAAKKKLT